MFLAYCDVLICWIHPPSLDEGIDTCFFCFFGGSATPCASPPPRPSIFSDYSFGVHHPVNRNVRHLLARAMASDFSFAWQFLSKKTISFLLWIKLHALIRLGVSPPSLIKTFFQFQEWVQLFWEEHSQRTRAFRGAEVADNHCCHCQTCV
jgi:hypothetical protein